MKLLLIIYLIGVVFATGYILAYEYIKTEAITVYDIISALLASLLSYLIIVYIFLVVMGWSYWIDKILGIVVIEKHSDGDYLN